MAVISCVYVDIIYFDAESHAMAQAGLNLLVVIPLPHPPKC